MIDKIGKLLTNIFGSQNERVVKGYMQRALAAGNFEQEAAQLSDAQLREKTGWFKGELARGTDASEILPQAFAVMRETADRHLGIRNVFVDEYKFDAGKLSDSGRAIYERLKEELNDDVSIHDLDVPVEFNAEIRGLYPESKPPFRFRHFDVQVLGGNVLYDGKIAEMATGEGKTLVATLAAYLVHITGKKVHVVTVNDYLAKRDADWMRPAFNALGLSVGAIQSDQNPSGPERKEQYGRDITYGTNNEFGFDYLRDNMKTNIEQMSQSELEYAIIDEVDSILIDEARTPLIISGPAFDDVTKYKKADTVVRQLLSLQKPYNDTKKKIDAAQRRLANAEGELSEAKRDKDKGRVEKAQQAIAEAEKDMGKFEDELAGKTEYYSVEIDRKIVRLTDEGEMAAQEIAGVGSFYTGGNSQWPHLIEQSLRAHVCFEREKDYVVMDGKVVIVDEFTGRLMQGRQWSDGLHQAVEAKENVSIKQESQTLATITLQNFFKLYKQIAGMTGTAATEAGEFMDIYKLDVVVIPTNKPCVRDDRDDMIYKTVREKFNAIVEEINHVSQMGRPVLVGTISVEKSEALSKALSQKFGIEHEVLNAKNHSREAAIVAKAGFQHTTRDGKTRGNVTIATNMAGRGTDIKLSEDVIDKGGLHVLGTERHEARRIDNQLRGRSGRQGDPGSSEFFLSFDDDLLSVFMPEWTIKAFSMVGWEEGEPIYHKRISKGIEKAQKKVEERNFEIRKSLLDYDEVMDYQRKYFYTRRQQILKGRGLKKIIMEMLEAAITETAETMLGEQYPLNCAAEFARSEFGVMVDAGELRDLQINEIEEMIKERTKKDAAGKISLSMGEYMADFSDSSTWDIQGLCRWAMSSFDVSLSASKAKHLSKDEIEQTLVEAANKQIDKKDCSKLVEYLDENYSLRMFADWVRNKFGIKVEIEQLANRKPGDIRDEIFGEIKQLYQKREVEYPVEFAMSMVYTPDGANVYAFDTLAKWAKKKYEAELDPEQLKELRPEELQKRLLELSGQWNNGKLVEEVEGKVDSLDAEQLKQWCRERFDAEVSEDSLSRPEEAKEAVLEIGREFMRGELSNLEKFVLLHVYDLAWKDHLYTMDHLKESISLRAFAERDPRIEYKREGHRMFQEMQSSIEERVTDTIFKVRIAPAEPQEAAVYKPSSSQHDEVGQFAMAEKQRAAAAGPQPQGEQQVKQIVMDKPKVGRNEPCPCGSGKKFKKCCGKNG